MKRCCADILRAAEGRPGFADWPAARAERIGADVESGLAEVGALRPATVLANPDFITRLKTNAPINLADRNTFWRQRGRLHRLSNPCPMS